MKLEAVVFGVMRAVTINCKSTLPGLTYVIKYVPEKDLHCLSPAIS